MIKKENIWVFIALIVIFFTELTGLEFLVYQNFQPLIILLIVSLAIFVMLRVLLIKKAAGKILGLFIKLYAQGYRYYVQIKKVATPYLIAAQEQFKSLYKKIITGTKDILNLKEVIPQREGITKSLNTALLKIRKRSFKYKAITITLLNSFITLFLITGLKVENGSMIIPNYLEMKFLIYKVLIQIIHKTFLIFDYLIPVILNCLILQNILLIFLTTSVVYCLSIRKFRGRIKNIFCGIYQITSEKFKVSYLRLQRNAEDIVNKKTWQQISKEAKLFKEELQVDLYKKEAKKRLATIAITSLITIILISGSIDYEKVLRTNFVAATIGKPCNNDISIQEDFCKKLPYPQPEPFVAVSMRNAEEEELAECCPCKGDPSNCPVDEYAQQYCHDNNETDPADAYCEGGECECYDYRAEPGEGDRIGVANCLGSSCYDFTLSCQGIHDDGECWYGLGPFYINKYGKPISETQVNVFVKKRFDWILTEKGELRPVEVEIKIW